MKKNEYVAPEMEIVEITEQYNLLTGSSLIEEDPDGRPGDVPREDEW